MSKIYTTYFAKLKKLPDDMIPISVCAKPPEGYAGLQYKLLAPTYNTLMGYKNTGDWSKFRTNYYNETLSKLDIQTVINDLKILGYGKDIALVCYEKSANNCHRKLIAEWFKDFGENCEELSI